MTIQNSKTIISYNGGSAGDLFVLSCNNLPLTGLRNCRVVQDATLKDYELRTKMGEQLSLGEFLSELPYNFVNTHLLDEIIDMGFDVYNVVMTDSIIQLKTIYRQMQIQKLRIKVGTDEWFTTIKNHSLSGNFIAAAEHWFQKAEYLWIERMQYRLNFEKAKKINFDFLYTEGFVDSLKFQGWTHNLDLLKSNHERWLVENQDFTYEKTINIMADKLSTMNWNQTDGWVEYNP